MSKLLDEREEVESDLAPEINVENMDGSTPVLKEGEEAKEDGEGA